MPDVCVTDAGYATEQILTKAPLLCVEVKSPEDRLPRMLERVKDFHRMGVGQVWVFEPKTQGVWVSMAEEWGGGLLRVAGTGIELYPAMAFAAMVRRRR